MNEDMGKVLLAGFDLDAAEKAICNNVIKNYSRKIKERADFDVIKIRLRKTEKGKNYLHEIEASLKAKSHMFTAKTSDYNLFAAIADAMEKLLNEMTHKMRTNRQRR